MSNEEIKQIAKEAAMEAIMQMRLEGKDKKLHNTRLLMRNYNTLKEHISSKEGHIEIRVKFDDEYCIEADYMWLESVARSKSRTAKMIKYVDDKIIYLRKKFEEKKQYERYRAFEMFFIEEKTNEEIQEELNCSKNIPKKWSDIVINELSVLLWGIDALGI